MKTIFNKQQDDAATKNRNSQRKLKIIQVISQQGEAITIPEICRKLDVSIPTGIKLVNELQEEGFLKVVGKKENQNGRKPLLYALNDPNFFAIAVEVSMKRISVALVDPGLNILKYRQKIDFKLENTQECLDQVEQFIQQCLEGCEVKEETVLGMGLGITGRVNTETGSSITYFNFMDKPLAEWLSDRFNTPVFIENDTRCLGMAEKNLGHAMNASNAVVINLSRGLGTSLIVNGNLVSGSAGYAGEFGHMHFGSQEKICLCGKVGCLGTVVGGHVLEEQFLQHIAESQPSLLSAESHEGIRYDQILDAALKGDQLSIRLIQQMGRTLGYALGNIINLLNPELVVLGGKFARLGNMMLDPMRSGMAESALINPLKMCRIEVSELGDMALLKGVGALVFEHFELLQNRVVENPVYF
ncbi:MAG TPA: ROK family transcriptional regulator [Bacteroidales bacterium]|nr:ROK family transcriptional regulator [Bacteroidales bacterium]